MAKALLGYVGGSDPRRARETSHLRRRVAELELEVRRLKEENDALAQAYRQVALPAERLDGGLHDLDAAARVLEPVAH